MLNKKNKKTQWILLLAVILVWGAVISQFFNFRSGTDAFAASVENTLPPLKESNEELKQIIISNNYRDPFMSWSAVNTRPRLKSASSTPSPKPVSKTNWPKIIYQGYLKRPEGQFVRLSIDRKMQTWKLGQGENGFSLQAVTPDSITISLGREKQVFYRR